MLKINEENGIKITLTFYQIMICPSRNMIHLDYATPIFSSLFTKTISLFSKKLTEQKFPDENHKMIGSHICFLFFPEQKHTCNTDQGSREGNC